jgi:hypothetical protein
MKMIKTQQNIKNKKKKTTGILKNIEDKSTFNN